MLNGSFLSHQLDNLVGRLDFYRVDFKQLAPVLLCGLFVVFVTICSLVFLRPRKEDDIRTRALLRSLLTVIVPTCSLWPSRYVEFASIHRSRVDLPLEVILEDATHGVIEFCNSVSHFADLIGSGITVDGHIIRIHTGWRWWINYLEWWMLTKSKPGHMFALFGWLRGNISSADPALPSLSFRPFALTSSASSPSLCLDYIPCDTVPSLRAGSRITLEFTAFSPSLRTFSSAQIISTLPFMHKDSHRWPRTHASVLEQLSTSYGPDLVVESLLNVSAEYEHALRYAHKTSFESQKTREVWVRKLGMRAWRRDMFLMALEAALVRRRWIERWAIQVAIG